MKNWACYAVILLSLVLSEAMLAPGQPLAADNMWHFKWASDVLAGNPIYWSGVDANRIFPDLLLSLGAAGLPGGQSFSAWTSYFFGISGLSLGLSLISLSRPLYSQSSARIVFFALSSAAFVTVTAALSYWSFWIVAPGNHGGSLCAVIAATALFLMYVKAERTNYALLFAFVLICAFLVMSNRYLVVSFMTPLLLAALASTQDRRRQVILVSATLLSTAAGLGVWHVLGSSHFYRLVAPGGQPSLHDALSWTWWEGRVPRELREFAAAPRQIQILFGLAVMCVAPVWSFWLLLRKPDGNSTIMVLRVFTLIVASSTIAAVMFVAVMVDDVGEWHYRYFVVPFCLAIIALSASAAPFLASPRQAWLVIVSLPALSVTIASISLSLSMARPTYATQLRGDLTQLSHLLAEYDGMTTHNGLANYWIANEVSVRSANINVLPLNDREPFIYRPYNNNAWELCRNVEFSFVLWEDNDQPGLGAIIKQLGPSLSHQRIQLGRFGPVQVLFYDPKLLEKAIAQPGRAAARREFPHFKCP